MLLSPKMAMIMMEAAIKAEEEDGKEMNETRNESTSSYCILLSCAR